MESKDGKKKEVFSFRQSFDSIGRELISLVAATLREIGKQDVEALTKADEKMLLPLAQKMSKVPNRRETKTSRTELIGGLGNTYGFGMARAGSPECWLMRVLCHMFYHEKPSQAQLGVMALLEAHK